MKMTLVASSDLKLLAPKIVTSFKPRIEAGRGERRARRLVRRDDRVGDRERAGGRIGRRNRG